MNITPVPNGEGGGRTHTPLGHMILSHACLPIPALPPAAKGAEKL